MEKSTTSDEREPGGVPKHIARLSSRLTKMRSTSFSRLAPPSHLLGQPDPFPFNLDHGVYSIQGKRPSMQDEVSAHPRIDTVEPQNAHYPAAQQSRPFAFFGVYDGHGGQKASEYVAEHLPRLFYEKTKGGQQLDSEFLSEALRQSFMEVEKNFLEKALETSDCSGTTAAVVVIKDTQLVVANVGDTEAVLCFAREGRDGTAVILTEVHSPKRNKLEGDRVKGMGGVLFNDRVGHPVYTPAICNIAISRAIGDVAFKAPSYTQDRPSGLIAEPYVYALNLSKSHKFCVIACDGVWDVMGDQEVVSFCWQRLYKERKKPEEVAKELVDAAYEKGSTDNISALIIVFRWK